MKILQNTVSLDLQLVGTSSSLLRWLNDDSITDILINGLESFYVESEGTLREEAHPFRKSEELFDLIERFCFPLGKRIDAAAPYMDGRLADGSRFHVILPPVALSGPMVSIRKFQRGGNGGQEGKSVRISDFGPDRVVDWICEQVVQRKNLILSGATGSGKTTLLGLLLGEISFDERIALLEESSEIVVEHPHAFRLEARQASPEGKGEVTLRCLLRNVLRMRPDRIIIGECRGQEAFDLLQAMNTGHSCLTTLHSNGAVDALKRLESLVLLAGLNVTQRTVREWIAASVYGVIQLEKVGSERRISEVIRVQGMEGDVYRIFPKYSSRPDRVFLPLAGEKRSVDPSFFDENF